MDIPAFAGIDEMARGLRDGTWSAVDLARHALDRIEAHDPRLSAFVSLTHDRALREAAAADARLAADPGAPLLCGIPFAAKDIIDVAGEITGGGCPVLKDNRATTDATVIERLGAAGMVLVGKTRTSPLACEITGLNRSETPPRNPWKDEPHVAGGSSSGSGVAVAAGLVPVALGSDTAGSVRAPAALCGVTGFKTTLGQVSRAGVLPLAESYDTIGPLTRSVADAAHVFEALRGPDPRDPSTGAARAGPTQGETRNIRFAIAEGQLFEDVDAEIVTAVRAFAEGITRLGLPVGRRDIPTFTRLAEGSDLEGLMAAEAWRANAAILEAWGDDRDPLTNWMMSGANVTDARIRTCRAAQRDLQTAFLKDAEDVDILIGPTVRKTTRATAMVDADQPAYVGAYVPNTMLGNDLNLCGLSLPCGLDSSGRPIGVMLYAKPFADDLLLEAGRMLAARGLVPDLQPPGFG